MSGKMDKTEARLNAVNDDLAEARVKTNHVPVDSVKLDWLRKAADLLQEADRQVDRWPDTLKKPERISHKIALAHGYIKLAVAWPNGVNW